MTIKEISLKFQELYKYKIYGKRQYKFRKIVPEVSYFVDKPI